MGAEIDVAAHSVTPTARPRNSAAPVRAFSRALAAPLAQRDVFCGLAAIGFLNAISEKVLTSISRAGASRALLDTFDVSLILWVGCLAALWSLYRMPARAMHGRDWLFAIACVALLLLPIPAAGSLALDLLAIYLLAQSRDRGTLKAALLLVALTMPLLWDRLLIAAFSDPILHFDATLVGWMIGTSVSGNVVPLPDGSGALFIAPACSSVANLSLAVVSCAVFASLPGRRWAVDDLMWSGLGALCVIAINVTRISLIGLYPQYFDVIHGAPGATVANCLTLFALLTIGYHKIGRHHEAVDR